MIAPSASPKAKINWCSWQSREESDNVSTISPPDAATQEETKRLPGPSMTNVPPAIQEKLALNPNSYIHLSPQHQSNVSVAFCCIRNGVRSSSIVKQIMVNCPSLRDHPTVWRMLIDSAVEPIILKKYASETITWDKKLMTRAIRNCGPQVFTCLPTQLKNSNNNELALLTLETMNRKSYRSNFASDQEFVRETENLLTQVLGSSSISTDPDAWRLIIQIFARFDLYYMVDVEEIWGQASPAILDDSSIMRKACIECSGDVLQFASDRLRRDVSLLQQVIRAKQHQENDFLLHIPEDVFLEHPSLMVSYLEHDGNTGTAVDVVPATLWQTNREIVDMYLRKGGQPHFDRMPENAGKDWDYCLAYVEGANHRRGQQPLTSWICEDLRNNKSFLLEAAKRNKSVLRYADSRSLDLLLVTAAYHGVEPLRTIQLSSQHRGSNDDAIDVIGFADQVKEMLQRRETFFTIMCGIGVERSASLLRMLNPDIAECIALFVGVPLGEQLQQLERALPVADELCRDPHCHQFLAGREYKMKPGYNVL